jgi:hypothetical protein
MSQKTIVIITIIYFAIGLIFVLILELESAVAEPYARPVSGAFLVGRILGTVLPIYVVSAPIPAGIWAFGRFRARSALIPFVTWGVLLVLGYAGLGFGLLYDLYRGTDEVSDFRSSFLRSTKLSCMDGQRKKSENNQKRRFTEAEIGGFCECFANEMLKQITTDEIKYMIRTSGGLPVAICYWCVGGSVKISKTS